MLTDEDLLGSLVAGADWNADRDFPDVVAWSDLRFADRATVAVIRDRLAGGLRPGRTHTLPLAKADGATYRQLAVCDPYDEVVYRALVGKVAPSVDASLGPEVMSYRVAGDGPEWRLRNRKYDDGRRLLVSASQMSTGFAGLGTLDVQGYYPSIGSTVLAQVLSAIGLCDTQIEPLTGYLDAWKDWGIRGLPIGPEASGVLGNAFLIPVDQRLRELTVGFCRYTDDIWLWPADEASFELAKLAVVEEAGNLGLQLNPDKDRWIDVRDDVYGRLFDRELDRISLLLRDDPAAGLQAVQCLFEAEAHSQTPNAKRLKYCVGVFTNRTLADALPFAQGRPELLRLCPKAWGRYLGMMFARRRVDGDWLVAAATATPCKETAAVQMHLLRACSKGHLSSELARPVEVLALTSERHWVPLRCAAAEAWGRSERWRPGTAADAAMNVGDAQHRRALTLTLRHTDVGHQRTKALRQLRTVAPECRPSVEWIEGCGDVAA